MSSSTIRFKNCAPVPHQSKYAVADPKPSEFILFPGFTSIYLSAQDRYSGSKKKLIAAEDGVSGKQRTLGQNRKKHRKNSHPIIHCPTSEGVSEVSERASECSGARE